MTYDIYRYIFLGGAGLAGLSLIIAVILFFVLKIPRVIGDLTGSTARKAIDEIRKQNEQSGNKIHKSSAVNLERGKITDKVTATGSVIKKQNDFPFGAMATAKISTEKLSDEAQQSYETSLLDNISNETTVLNAGGSGETTVLNQSETDSNIFIIEYEITFVHTDEVI